MKKLIVVILLFPSLAFSGEYKISDWPHWKDLDSDCQNTRTEVLIRDSWVPVTFTSDQKCQVVFGEWRCEYTGHVSSQASDIVIAHVVPLANAHRSGAENWTMAQKKNFANDPENLFCVGNKAYQSQGNNGPEEWRPPLRLNWRNCAKRWVYIKEKYGLSYAPGELEALGEMLK